MNESVFISCSKEDSDFAKKLAKDLETKEFEVFCEHENIRPGDRTLTLIGDALGKAHYIIIILSHTSTGSDWATFQQDIGVTRAISNKNAKKVIPLFIDDCEIPTLFVDFSPVEFKNKNEYQQNLDHLLTGLINHEKEKPSNFSNLIMQEPRTSEIHSYLVRFIIYVLTRSETEKHNIMAVLEIDNHVLSLLLRGNSIKQVDQKITLHLPQLTVDKRLFNTTRDAINFITVNEGTLNDLKEKISLIIESSGTGKKLITLLKDYISRMEMTQQWNRIVGQNSSILAAHDNTKEVLKAMRKIYFRAGITWSKSQMRLFVKSDFEKNLWEHIIDSAQDQVPENKLTHLHHANVFLGEQLGEFFSKDRKHSKNYGAVRKKFNILECGVGGANTTHQVLQCIIEKCEKIEPFEVIQYKGFEVNEAFAEQADNILKGEYIGNNLLQMKDSRSDFFSSLNKNGKQRFHPLFSNIETFGKTWTNKFVENVDMSDGVASLAISLEGKQEGDIDLFLCSYALHHVPNGHDLRTFIFGGSKAPLDRLNLRTPEGEKFCNYIQHVLKSFIHNKTIPLKLKVKFESHYGRALIELIQLENKYHYQVEELLKDFQLYIKNNTTITGVFTNSSWSNAIIDYQEKLLSEVYGLLRPGGYLAIADPDGYSKYNRENIPKNAEMGVAHFLSRSQLVALLEKLKFTLVNRWTQRKNEEKGQYDEVAEPDSIYREIKGIEDPNCGYIVIAKKPIN